MLNQEFKHRGWPDSSYPRFMRYGAIFQMKTGRQPAPDEPRIVTPAWALERAADIGADAVSVSNHGGNGLDGGPATIRVLPEIVAAVDDRIEVLLDGGVRRGGDVVKAVALGARAVLIGRPYIWALAAGGQSGVTELLALYRRNIDATLRLLACPSVEALDPSVLRMPQRGCNCK